MQRMRKAGQPLFPQTVFMLLGKLSGGEIAALKSWNVPKVFVWQSCGLHRPCTQTDVVALTRQSAHSRTTAPQCGMCWLNTVYRSSVLGWCFFSLHCFGLAKARMGGWEMRVGGKGPDFDQIVRRLVVSGFDRHAVILCFCSLAAACGSSSRLMFDFGCFSEFQPGMCRSKDKRAIHQTTAELQINSLKISQFIVRSQSHFLAL